MMETAASAGTADPVNSPESHTDRLAAAAAIVSFGAWLAHCVWVISGPERRVMAWLYDDCFYYVITAWHLALQGISSFDGSTRTSGYHPLWMWICTALVHLHSGLDLTLVRLCMAASALITASVMFSLLVWALRRGQNAWLWTLAIGCSSYSAWNNGLTIMEWPVVLLFWAVLHAQLLRVVDRRRASAGSMLLALGIGVMLTLSRTDSGLIPAAYAAGGLLLYLRHRNAAVMQQGVSAIAGAVAGLGLTAVYNHAMTGSWLQQSAMVKHLFAEVTTPFNSVPVIWQFLRVLLFLPRLELQGEAFRRAVHLSVVPLVVLVAALVVIAAMQRRSLANLWKRQSAKDQFVLAASALGIFAYVLLYSFNSGAMFGWYTAPVTGFILCITAIAFRGVPRRVAGPVVFATLALDAAGLIYGGGNAAVQFGENACGKYLRAHFDGAVLSGGDVGKESFYNHGTMINTDGLMNNEVVPYLIAGRLHCYLLQRHVAYTTGLGSIAFTLEQQVRARRGDPPLPWQRLLSHETAAWDNETAAYDVVHPDAIRATGECDEPLPPKGTTQGTDSGSR